MQKHLYIESPRLSLPSPCLPDPTIDKSKADVTFFYRPQLHSSLVAGANIFFHRKPHFNLSELELYSLIEITLSSCKGLVCVGGKARFDLVYNDFSSSELTALFVEREVVRRIGAAPSDLMKMRSMHQYTEHDTKIVRLCIRRIAGTGAQI